MKALLFFILVSVALYLAYIPAGTTKNISFPSTVSPLRDSIHFSLQIEPILTTHCNPCHFPGGKMYERLPFDKASTILKPEIRPGLLKRINDKKENEIVRKFIEQQERS